MTRDEIENMLGELVGESMASMRADLEARLDRAVDAKPLPPFVPPPPWTEGRHSEGRVVRHRNGLFVARYDTASEPGTSMAWAPLLVGIADFAIEWTNDRTLEIRCTLSDGNEIVRGHEFPVPLTRGEWQPDENYRPGDRVIHGSEYEALVPNSGEKPGLEGSEKTWLRVARKYQRAIDLVLANDGQFTNHGHAVGNIKPVLTEVLGTLLAQHGNGGSHDGR